MRHHMVKGVALLVLSWVHAWLGHVQRSMCALVGRPGVEVRYCFS